MRKPDGTTGFEFEARPAKAGAPAKRAGKLANGVDVVTPPAVTLPKTRVRPAVVSSAAPAVPLKARKQARKTSSAVARKTNAKVARNAGSRKPAARG